MHGQLETSMGFTLMCSDVPGSMELDGGRQHHRQPERRRRRGAARLLGAAVRRRHRVFPLERQMWGDEFGQCKDRFGVPWLVNIAAG